MDHFSAEAINDNLRLIKKTYILTESEIAKIKCYCDPTSSHLGVTISLDRLNDRICVSGYDSYAFLRQYSDPGSTVWI